MKKLIFIALAFIAVTSCKENTDVSVGNKTTLEVNKVYDAGDVIKGEMVEAKFTVKNTGDYPLVFGEVKGSCSCTVTEAPDEPIAPGESAVIAANVDTEKTGAGAITKSVTIMANTDPSNTLVTIKANVLNRK